MKSDRDTRMKRLRRVGLGVALLAAIGAAIPLYLRYYGAPRRFAVVEEGVLYRSGQPYHGEIEHLADEMGLKTILIVREGLSRRVPDERAKAESLGIKVIHIPIKSRQPIPEEHIEAFFSHVDDPENHPVLVHCSAGRHRTGLLCALYRIRRQGWGVDEALAEMRSFEPDMDPQRPVLQQLKRLKGEDIENGAAGIGAESDPPAKAPSS